MCSVKGLLVTFFCFLAASTDSETQNVGGPKVSKAVDVFLPPKVTPVLGKLVLGTDTREPLAQGSVKFGAPKSAQYSRWNTFGRDTLYGTADSSDLDDTSRVAPTSGTDPSGGFGYNVTESRLRTIRSQFMYWYFDQGGNDGNGDYQKDIHTSSPTIHKNFNFQLPFFGFRFNYTRISMHGYLEFSDPPDHYTYPLSFPNQDWPKKNDPAFIGIFFSKCRIGSIRPTDIDQRRPGIYFRMERDLQTRTDRFGVEMRERLMWDIRTGVVGADTFYPKHSAIITWKNMSFAGGVDNSLYKTNTFQMVLATDEIFTYAIFNYNSIQWTSHTEAGGDTTGGEGGVPAYIGFNAGNGTRSAEYNPYSQTTAIRDLTGRGWANGFPGRHIFRIDENILLGTCNKDIAGANLQLMFAPESGNMLGGTVVNITGPCFTPDMKVRCRFDIADVVGTVVDTNRAICVQPFVMAEGYVILDVAIGDGAYNWKGKYFIETPATAQLRIFFDTEDVHLANPKQIKFTWDQKNLTSLTTASVKIELYGYRETTITPELILIDTIEDGITNSGSYTIVPANYKNRNNYLYTDVRFGFVKLSLTNPTQYSGLSVSPVLWSRPIPVGWYFAPQWQNMYGYNWANAMCDEWIMNDRYLKNFAAEIAQCPCTLDHALADKGRFMPDFDCDYDTNPQCRYNKGAVQCVKTGSPSYEGSEQQCCYDKNRYLMLSYDQQWGSRPRRSHNFGYIPWIEANKVPTLSQWYHDMSPFYFCCLWQEEQAVGCETFRFERRPSQDCVAYQSPYVATVFGDPHIITFDGLEYTFNGKGEFVLVHSDSPKFKLDVQGRFEQLPNNFYGEVRATQLTSIAARDNTSAVIEVRIRPKIAQWRYRLDVFANYKRIYFDRPALRVQHFPGVTVYQPMYVLNQSQIIIMFQSGAGVEVVENRGYITARVYLPWKFINQTRGLMGNWSFDISDDFTKPDGTQAPVTNLNNFERLHKDFAINWLLEDREDTTKGPSLFHREYRRTASYYANRTFVPEWKMTPEEIISSNRTQDIAFANSFCGDSYQCKFDYAVSLDRDLAFYTLKYQDAYTAITTTNKQRIITCGILETPRFGRKSNFFFVPGTKVTFECNQDFVLVGDQRRTCTASGSWDVPVYGYTECLRMVEYDIQKILTTAMIILLILLPLLITLLCCASYLVRKARGEGSSASWRYLTTSNAGRRSSIASRQESVPLKSAANLVDADSGLGLPAKEVVILPKNVKNTLQTQPAKEDDPDWKYDGVYFTHEPIPGLPEIEFEDKIWDFNDDDVFASRTNSSFSSPLSDRNGSVEYSMPMKQPKITNFRPSRENLPSQILKPSVVGPPMRLNSTGSTSTSSSPLPVVVQAVVNPERKIVEETIPPPQKIREIFALPPTSLIPSPPPPPVPNNPPKNDKDVVGNTPQVTRSSITTAI